MPYIKLNFVNDAAPDLDGPNMAHIEAGIAAAPYGPDGASGFVPVGDGSGAWVYKKITNAEIDPAAAIAYSKLALGNSIVNADIAAGAAIALTKLATIPAAHVFHNAAQSVPNSVPAGTALLFNSERFDTDTIHDTVTNNSRLTCKTAGKYLIGGGIEWPGNVTGTIRQVFIRLNGTTSIGEDLRGNNGAQVVRQVVTTIYDMAVNDYVELMANQDTGGAWNVNSAAAFTPEFWMVRVG